MTTEFEREIRAAFAETIPARADPALAISIRARLAEASVVRRGTGPSLGRSGFPAFFTAAVLAAAVIVIVAAPLIGQLRQPTPSADPGQVVGASPSTSAPAAPTPTPTPGNIPLHKDMFGDASVREARLVTDTIGWVVTSSGLYRTADGGKSWTEARNWPVAAAAPASIDIVDADTVYLQVATGIAATHDGGASWSEAVIPGESAGSLGYGPIFTFRTAAIGAATFASTDPGQSGRLRVFQTSDGGLIWVDRGTSVLPEGETKLAPNDGEVLSLNLGKADNKPFNDHLWLSTDGGLTWKDRTFPIDAVSPAGVLKWVAGTTWIGDGGRIVLPITVDGSLSAIYESRDDGQSWRLIDHREQPAGADFDVQLRSATDWVEAALDGSEIWSTTDGGGHWRLVTGQAPIWQLSMSWASQDHGWAVHGCSRHPSISHGPDPLCDGNALTSVVLETIDGGRTWVPIGG